MPDHSPACTGQLCSPCIFFKLSSNGFEPAADVLADGMGRVLAAGKEKVRALGPDVVSTGRSGMESVEEGGQPVLSCMAPKTKPKNLLALLHTSITQMTPENYTEESRLPAPLQGLTHKPHSLGLRSGEQRGALLPASSSRTLLNLCSVAFLSASKSSEVAE